MLDFGHSSIDRDSTLPMGIYATRPFLQSRCEVTPTGTIHQPWTGSTVQYAPLRTAADYAARFPNLPRYADQKVMSQNEGVHFP
jgi:hypothetical protein